MLYDLCTSEDSEYMWFKEGTPPSPANDDDNKEEAEDEEKDGG